MTDSEKIKWTAKELQQEAMKYDDFPEWSVEDFEQALDNWREHDYTMLNREEMDMFFAWCNQ